MLYSMCFLLFIIGLYCVLVKKNMVKIVLGIVIMEYAVNLFLIMLGYRTGGIAPILSQNEYAAGAVDAVLFRARCEHSPPLCPDLCDRDRGGVPVRHHAGRSGQELRFGI